MVVGVVLEVLQTEVLQLALELVEAELVGQRRIEVCGFHRDLLLCLDVLRVLDLPHDADAVGYHNEDDAHVLGKGDEQAAEILAAYRCALGIEFANAHQSVQDVCHLLAKVATHLIYRGCSALHDGVEQDTQYAAARQADLFADDECSLQVLDNRVDAKSVALEQTLLCSLAKVITQFLFVAFLNDVGSHGKEIFLHGFCANSLLVCKELSYLHFLLHYILCRSFVALRLFR